MYTIRCKTRDGLSCKWGIGQTKDGKWKAMSLGQIKRGRYPVPTDFAPFHLMEAVVNGPRFDTKAEAELYAAMVQYRVHLGMDLESAQMLVAVLMDGVSDEEVKENLLALTGGDE